MVGVTLINATLGIEKNPGAIAHMVKSLALPDAFLCDVRGLRGELKLNTIGIRSVHVVLFVI